MGLDMYLTGSKYHSKHNNQGKVIEREMVDGFPVKETRLELGYWRKHPNLHGFIVNEFAEGKDNCQEIELTREDCLKIAKAIENDNLPDTSGFFFGDSAWHKKEANVEVFRKAAEWLGEKDWTKTVIYQASW